MPIRDSIRFDLSIIRKKANYANIMTTHQNKVKIERASIHDAKIKRTNINKVEL